jgi:predicted short-subunit dehydrogenase-like oxidoreductase (DUF2520 family)
MNKHRLGQKRAITINSAIEPGYLFASSKIFSVEISGSALRMRATGRVLYHSLSGLASGKSVNEIESKSRLTAA